VVRERLHEKLIAEDAAIEDLVPPVGRHDVLAALRAAARLDLCLRDNELRRPDVELLRCRLDADARDLDVAERADAVGSGNEQHVWDARQVRG
jgi:hypothetical protein